MKLQARERAEPTLVGQTIDGRYELTRLLSQGGMGAVYEARNVTTSKRCAVKLLLSAEIDPSSPAVRRFLHESRSSSAVESDHIVHVFDAGLDGESGTPYIVMELLRGEDLRALSKRLGSLPPELVARLTLQAALGLAKAHEAGVVHRDVKPANLFLTERDNGEYLLKVVDFGIAKVKTSAGLESQEVLTQGGHVLGTPAYMSPEQARGDGDASADCDVWSLGVVMFELLTGRLPYAKTTPLATLMAAIVTEPIPLLSEVAPWVPADLRSIVERATSRDRRERYADAGQLRDTLAAACQHDTRVTRSMLRTLPANEQRPSTAAAQALPAPFLGDDLRVTGDLPHASPVRAPAAATPRFRIVAIVAACLALAAGLALWRAPSPGDTGNAVASSSSPPALPSSASPPATAASSQRLNELAAPSQAAASTLSSLVPKATTPSPPPPASRAVSTPAAPAPQPSAARSAEPRVRQRSQLSDAVEEFR